MIYNDNIEYKCNECNFNFIEPKEMSIEMFYGISDMFSNFNDKVKLCPNCESNNIKIIEKGNDENE